MVQDFAVLFCFVAPVAYILTFIFHKLFSPFFSAFLGFFSAVWMAVDNYTIVCDMREMLKDMPLSKKTMRWALLSAKARALYYYTKAEVRRRRRKKSLSFNDILNANLASGQTSAAISPAALPVVTASPPPLVFSDSF